MAKSQTHLQDIFWLNVTGVVRLICFVTCSKVEVARSFKQGSDVTRKLTLPLRYVNFDEAWQCAKNYKTFRTHDFSWVIAHDTAWVLLLPHECPRTRHRTPQANQSMWSLASSPTRPCNVQQSELGLVASHQEPSTNARQCIKNASFAEAKPHILDG